jgi:hypothetical protein
VTRRISENECLAATRRMSMGCYAWSLLTGTNLGTVCLYAHPRYGMQPLYGKFRLRPHLVLGKMALRERKRPGVLRMSAAVSFRLFARHHAGLLLCKRGESMWLLLSPGLSVVR